MKKSKDEKVQKFLDEISATNSDKCNVLQELRRLVFKACPKVNERIMYGGIMFSLEEDFGGLFTYKNHISFEFSMGVNFKDPNGELEGSGKYRRHLKIKSFSDIKAKDVVFFVKQVI